MGRRAGGGIGGRRKWPGKSIKAAVRPPEYKRAAQEKQGGLRAGRERESRNRTGIRVARSRPGHWAGTH